MFTFPDPLYLFHTIAYMERIPREYEFDPTKPCPECGRVYTSAKRALHHYRRLSCVTVKELGKYYYLSTAKYMTYSRKLQRLFLNKVSDYNVFTINSDLNRTIIRSLVQQHISIQGDYLHHHLPNILKTKRVRQIHLLNEKKIRKSHPILPPCITVTCNPFTFDLSDIKTRDDIRTYINETVQDYGTFSFNSWPVGLLSE